MELKQYLLFSIFGISLLPKIYSDGFPSLFIIKNPNKTYALADKLQLDESQDNYLKFSMTPRHELYNACPEENARHGRPDALKPQKSVKNFEGRPLQQFFEGDFPKYNCRNPIKPIALKSKEKFENTFVREYDTGFLIHEEKANVGKLWKKYLSLPQVPEYAFITFLTISMDKSNGTIKWVRHRIISQGLMQLESPLNPPPPNEDNVYDYGFDVNSLYTQENQHQMFSSIFGESYYRYYHQQEDRYLIKVQLAPYEDFLLHTWRLPSFMDLNTTPMWKKLYPRWRKIEIFVREVAQDLEPLIVETGTAKILTLADDSDNLQSVYLRKARKSPVPKYIWKQITFRQSDNDANPRAILIVMHNDPYTENQERICNDVGENLGWMVSNNDYKTGLTYVCLVSEKITTKLDEEYKANLPSLNLNIEQWSEFDENDVYPSLIIKKINKNYAVADEIQHVEDQQNLLKFSTSPEYLLFSACPKENASHYRDVVLKVQRSVTDIAAIPLKEFVKGDFVTYNCRNPIKPIALRSMEKAENKFELEYDIGFLIYEWNGDLGELWKKYASLPKVPEYDFIPILTVTMDRIFRSIKRVRHRIISKVLLESDSALESLPSTEKNVDIYGFDVDALYTEENQQHMFSSIFSESYSRYYDHQEDRCLIKVQLAPNQDFLLDTWKLSSFMNLNTAAMWKQLHNQWRMIEIFVRKVARDLEPLIVETGTAEILTLAKSNNQSHSVYLRQKQKSPVAKYFWKLITFRQSHDDVNTYAILIIMHNDPYTQNQELICEDVGENLGWMVSNNDYKTGITYVCLVNENITTQLGVGFNENYENFDLKTVHKLESVKNDIYPSLFIIKKPNNNYAVADGFQYVEGENNFLKFSISPEYQLYNACPEENAPFHWKYTLKVQESVTDFKATPREQFVKGDFVKYNCSNPIKPVALKSKKKFTNRFLFEYHTGFLIREKNGNHQKLSKLYEYITKIQEYDFLQFLGIRMDAQSKTVLEVSHQIISRGLLEPDSAYSGPIQPYQNNFYFFRFDVNSLYTEENQQKMFSSTFPERYSEYYSYPNQSLRKVQLAPHEDFPLNIWKLPSFMNLNTTPMWEQLYFQWRKIEIFVRKVARELDPLNIKTGAARILALRDADNEMKSFFLRKGQKFPARKYIWKQVTFKQSDDDGNTQAILIVMHNDPYNSDQTQICDDVGEKLGWTISNNDYKTGLTYVCPVEEIIMKKLHSEQTRNYPSLNLNNVRMLKYDENGEEKWVHEDIASKIRPNTLPSLFVIKEPDNNYAVADEFEYVEGRDNVVKFSTPPEYPLYNACPEENAPFYPTYALKIQELVTDFEGRPLQQFFKGDFIKYNCRNPIKPIVLKSKKRFVDTTVEEYSIGFLIHDTNGKFNKLSELYENFTDIQEYDFRHFLTITMDRKWGTILSVLHRIISRGLLEPEPAYSGPFPPNEKNVDIYSFDVDFFYTEENQQEKFSSIFGQKYTDYYNPPNQRLRKVQLAPPEDFPLDTWKLTSFMDLNTTAIWEQLHHQWRRIEIFVRKVARELEALTIETGTANVLSLPNHNDEPKRVHLHKNRKLTVQKYIWKLIMFDQLLGNDVNTQAILIVMHNDPYTPDQEPICDDVSENWGWMVSNKDYKTGLTYACQVAENITSMLHEDFKVEYPSLNLNKVQKLEYHKNGEEKWVNEDIASKIRNIFPSLIITKKPDNNYAVADKFQYIEGENNIFKFSTSLKYRLYNACPEENAPLYQTYAVKVQQLVKDLEAETLKQFVKGDFAKYNCRSPIRPIVLKSKQTSKNEFVFEYHIGFLIHDVNGNFNKLSELYENFPETREYYFVQFLALMMDSKSGTTISVLHRITSTELLKSELAFSALYQDNEENVDVYGFHVNSLYTDENQRKMFYLIFGQLYTNYYKPTNKILRKIQLAPHKDFLLNIWKLPSFMDLNTTSMWKQLHAQWRRIEKFIREVARVLGKLTIETGASRILTLTDENHLQQSVYLREEQKTPVAKYIWKLIMFDPLNVDYYTQAILIVMHNDPYTWNQKPICDDVSENWGWMVSNKDYKSGLTYGCPVNENITTLLHDEYKTNYASFNLNDVHMFEYDENDTFLSLFIIKKPNTFYAVANEFEYVKVDGQDSLLKFSISPGYQLYNACPEENAHFHRTYTLKVQKLVTDFEATSLQQMVIGEFARYNCRYPIKPIVLKSKRRFKYQFTNQYDIGFLIHEKNGKFENLSEEYENFTQVQEYDFLPFLNITMDRQSGTILSVVHRIISGGLLEPESPYSCPFQHNEKNADVYGFIVNNLYTEENQQNIFFSIFDASYAEYYNPPNRSLRKIQLAPYEDFLINIWKLPSFMDLNTTAMWEQLLSQWRRIEIFVRKVALELEALTIETGAARILSLTDAEGIQQPVYLREEKKSQLAKYIWKLIMLKSDHYYTQAILIVMHNDPYSPDQEPICDDMSENWGWMVSNKDYKTGLTYGCQVTGNIMRNLHDEYDVNYASFDLNTVHKLKYDENGSEKWVEENIYLKVMSRS